MTSLHSCQGRRIGRQSHQMVGVVVGALRKTDSHDCDSGGYLACSCNYVAYGGEALAKPRGTSCVTRDGGYVAHRDGTLAKFHGRRCMACGGGDPAKPQCGGCVAYCGGCVACGGHALWWWVCVHKRRRHPRQDLRWRVRVHQRWRQRDFLARWGHLTRRGLDPSPGCKMQGPLVGCCHHLRPWRNKEEDKVREEIVTGESYEKRS